MLKIVACSRVIKRGGSWSPASSHSGTTMNEIFRRFAFRTSAVVGSSRAFLLALAVLILWAMTGAYYRYSDTWQLVINTGTSVVTFLMVFLIQNTQNRDARAIHLKLDELLRAVREARTELVSLEERPDEELAHLKQEFQKLHDEGVVVKAPGCDGRADEGRWVAQPAARRPGAPRAGRIGEL
jgi:low affinity Fe/Cu permease